MRCILVLFYVLLDSVLCSFISIEASGDMDSNVQILGVGPHSQRLEFFGNNTPSAISISLQGYNLDMNLVNGATCGIYSHYTDRYIFKSPFRNSLYYPYSDFYVIAKLSLQGINPSEVIWPLLYDNIYGFLDNVAADPAGFRNTVVFRIRRFSFNNNNNSSSVGSRFNSPYMEPHHATPYCSTVQINNYQAVTIPPSVGNGSHFEINNYQATIPSAVGNGSRFEINNYQAVTIPPSVGNGSRFAINNHQVATSPHSASNGSNIEVNNHQETAPLRTQQRLVFINESGSGRCERYRRKRAYDQRLIFTETTNSTNSNNLQNQHNPMQTNIVETSNAASSNSDIEIVELTESIEEKSANMDRIQISNLCTSDASRISDSEEEKSANMDRIQISNLCTSDASQISDSEEEKSANVNRIKISNLCKSANLERIDVQNLIN